MDNSLTWFEEQEARLMAIRRAHLKMIHELGGFKLLNRPKGSSLKKQRAVWAVIKQAGQQIPLRVSLERMTGCSKETVRRVFQKLNIVIERKTQIPKVRSGGYSCTSLSREPGNGC